MKTTNFVKENKKSLKSLIPSINFKTINMDQIDINDDQLSEHFNHALTDRGPPQSR